MADRRPALQDRQRRSPLITQPGRAERRTRNALLVTFGLSGLGFASFVARTPAIGESLDASTSHMGYVILCMSVGSIIGIAIWSRLIASYGARAGILLGTLFLGAGLAGIGVGSQLGSITLVMAAMACCGLGYGFAEVAVTVEAVALETRLDRSVLPSVHAAFSGGSLAGAGLATIAVSQGLPVIDHLGLAALGVLGGAVLVRRGVTPGTGARHIVKSGPPGAGAPASTGAAAPDAPDGGLPGGSWRDRRTLLIGLTLLGGAFAEGTANDWIPLASKHGHHTSAVTASAIYAMWGLAALVTRMAGNRLVDSFGRARVLRVMCAVGVAGMSMFIVGRDTAVIVCGAVGWGVGAALYFPLTLSAAGEGGGDTSGRVSHVAGLGYIAFLVGPPTLGTLGQHYGLLRSFVPIVVGLATSGLLAGSLSPVQSPAPAP